MSLYQQILFPLLRQFDPETTHDRTLQALALAQERRLGRVLLKRISGKTPNRPVKLFGLRFANELGVAAGFDKNAEAITGLGCLGFGHVEVGTLTPAAQKGNPRPRVFRLPEDRALVNRMGFPNRGVKDALARIARSRAKSDVIIGVSLGKQKETELEDAALDYLKVMEAVYLEADYLAVNVSSPNTPGLRELQGPTYLRQLLEAMRKGIVDLADRHKTGARPLLLKISPDLSWKELDSILEVSEESGVSGIIASNTTISRSGLSSHKQSESGGLSGWPLGNRSNEIIAYISRRCGQRLPVIGVGGIMTADGVLRKLDAGASLVQLYTGLVYGGPGVAGRILRELGSARQ